MANGCSSFQRWHVSKLSQTSRHLPSPSSGRRLSKVRGIAVGELCSEDVAQQRRFGGNGSNGSSNSTAMFWWSFKIDLNPKQSKAIQISINPINQRSSKYLTGYVLPPWRFPLTCISNWVHSMTNPYLRTIVSTYNFFHTHISIYIYNI